MAWPKTLVFPDGFKVEVDSWEEIREAREQLGGDASVVSTPDGGQPDGAMPVRRHAPTGASTLTPHDRSLLEQFIEAGSKGILTQSLGDAIGAQGKGVRPALERWSRKIGLVTEENAKPFESTKSFNGRGIKMVEHYRRVAGQMLGR